MEKQIKLDEASQRSSLTHETVLTPLGVRCHHGCGGVLKIARGDASTLKITMRRADLAHFSLQVSVKVKNTKIDPWNADGWELIFIPTTSGVVALERGAASTFAGELLRKPMY